MTPDDVLWGMYQEHCTQGRHHEEQRSTTTNLVLALAGAALGLISFKEFTHEMWPLAAFVTMLGAFGAAFSFKHYERFRYHMKCAGEFKDAVEAMLPSTLLKSHRANAKRQHEAAKRYKLIREIHLFAFWIGLNVLLSVLGGAVLILVLVK